MNPAWRDAQTAHYRHSGRSTNVITLGSQVVASQAHDQLPVKVASLALPIVVGSAQGMRDAQACVRGANHVIEFLSENNIALSTVIVDEQSQFPVA